MKQQQKGSTRSSSHANSSLQSVLRDRFEGRPIPTQEKSKKKQEKKKKKFARGATFVQTVVTINAEDATASNRRIRKQTTSLFRTNKALERADETTIGTTATNYNIYSSQAGSEPAAEPITMPLPSAQSLHSSRRKVVQPGQNNRPVDSWLGDKSRPGHDV